MENLLAALTATISELKASPHKVLNQASHEPVVILSQNKPWAYLIPPNTFEQMQEEIEDYRLLREARERQGDDAISVTLDELRAGVPNKRQT